MVRRTKADAMETRGALLDAAEALFSRQGVTNTSMMQVAEEAGVTRGAIYHHFRNKLDLISSLMERVRLPVEEMRCQVNAAMAHDPVEQIRLRTQQFIRHMKNDPHTRALVEILLHKCEYIDDVLPIKLRHLEGRNECIEEFEVLFQTAKNEQALPDSVNTTHAVVGLFSLIDGLMYNWLLDPNYFDIIAVADSSVGAYLHGLQKQ